MFNILHPKMLRNIGRIQHGSVSQDIQLSKNIRFLVPSIMFVYFVFVPVHFSLPFL